MNNRPRCPSILAAAFLAAAGATTSASAANAHYRFVARTGQAAPGGGLFSEFGVPVISPGGRVAFQASRSGILAPSGVWSEGVAGLNNLELVARQSDPVPGVANTFIDSLYPSGGMLIMNALGEVAFPAKISGDQTEFGENALLIHTASGVDSIAVPGQLVSLPCQGFGCSRWLTDIDPFTFAFNAAAQVAFHSKIAGVGVNNGNDHLVLRADASTMEAVIREGDVPPGTLGVMYTGSSWHQPHINSSGEILIRNWLRSNDETSSYWSVWRGGPGDMSLVAAQGWTTPMGGEFWGHWIGSGVMGFNDAGQALFVQAAEFSEDDQRTGLWLETNGSIQAVCFEGMTAPSGHDYFAPDLFTGELNGQGDALFHAILQGAGVNFDNDEALVRRTGAGISEVIVREGDQVPGFLNGVVFDAIGWFGETILNDGRVVFGSRLSGPGIHDGNDLSLWITRPGASPALLIREGQVIAVGGALRTVGDFAMSLGAGAENGLHTSVSQHGQVALRVTFTDGVQVIMVASPRSACPGDVNGDGVVNFTDLNAIVSSFNYEGDIIPADLDLDGDVDFDDLNTLLSDFNEVCD